MEKSKELWKKIGNMFANNADDIKQRYNLTSEYTKLLTDLLVRLGESEPEYGTVDLEYWPRVDISFFDKWTVHNWTEWAREVAIEIENDEGLS